MPLYEYRCDDCAESFEILQRMDENGDGLRCPSCDHPHVRRQLSTFAAATGNGGGAAMQAGPAGCCRGTPT